MQKRCMKQRLDNFQKRRITSKKEQQEEEEATFG